jgi:arylsulfatase A-like enzyme
MGGRVLLPAALLVSALFGARAAAAPPNVVLIVVDTLRADGVGCYGASRDTTPAIDELASEGVRFQRAYSTAPWTMPSVGSMFTGTYPGTCRSTGTWGPLPDDMLTLAEVLREEGYATAGIISHFLLGSRFNFNQGFEIFIESEANVKNMHDHVSTEGVTRRALEVLRQFSAKGGPFFLFAHYFDPHYNYKRHREYGFAAAGAGRLDGSQPIEKIRQMLPDMTGEETAFLRSLYDEEVRHTDFGIGLLTDALRKLGLYENSIVVVVSDHGEEFLEHGWLGHTKTLYEELVHVPLVIKAPGRGRPGSVIDDRVSLVSLTPTILDLAGLDIPGQKYHGASFAGLMDGESREGPSYVLCEADFNSTLPDDIGKETNKKAIVGKDYKLILDVRSGNVELFDLGKDPREEHNLAAKRPEAVERLLPVLEKMVRAAGLPASPPRRSKLSSEEVERLRSLGYIR